MAIHVKGWHGALPPKLAKKLDAIAMPLDKVGYEWEFEGSIGDFAEQWADKFLAFCDKPRPGDNPTLWNVFVTQYSSFGQR